MGMIDPSHRRKVVNIDTGEAKGGSSGVTHDLASKIYSHAEIRAPEVSKDTNVGDKINEVFKLTLDKNIEKNFLDPALELIADRAAGVNLPQKSSSMGYGTSKVEKVKGLEAFFKVDVTEVKPHKTEVDRKIEEWKNHFLIILSSVNGEDIGTITDRREAAMDVEADNMAYINFNTNRVVCTRGNEERLQRILERRRLRRDAQAGERFRQLLDELEANPMQIIVFDPEDDEWNQIVNQFETVEIDYDEIEREMNASRDEVQKPQVVTGGESSKEAEQAQEAAGKVAETSRGRGAGKSKVDMEEMMEQWMEDVELRKKIAETVNRKLEKALKEVARQKNLEIKEEEVREKLKEAILHDEDFRAQIKEEIKKEILKKFRVSKDRDTFRISDEESNKIMQINKIQYRGDETFLAWQVTLSRIHGDRFSGKDVERIEPNKK